MLPNTTFQTFPKINLLFKEKDERKNSNLSEIKILREKINILTDMIVEFSREIDDIKQKMIEKSNSNSSNSNDNNDNNDNNDKAKTYKFNFGYIASSVVLAVSLFYYKYKNNK